MGKTIFLSPAEVKGAVFLDEPQPSSPEPSPAEVVSPPAPSAAMPRAKATAVPLTPEKRARIDAMIKAGTTPDPTWADHLRSLNDEFAKSNQAAGQGIVDAADGLTFGAGKRIVAGAAALGDKLAMAAGLARGGHSYAEYRRAYEEQAAANRAASPLTAAYVEPLAMGPAILAGGGEAAVAKGAGAVTEGASALRQALREMATGGKAGLVIGGGNAADALASGGDYKDALKELGSSVALNAGLSGAFHAGGRVIAGAPERVAARIVPDVVGATEGAPGAARASTARYVEQRAGEGGANLMDVAEKTGLDRVLSVHSLDNPGRVAARVGNVLTDLEKQKDRLYSAIDSVPGAHREAGLVSMDLRSQAKAYARTGRGEMADVFDRQADAIDRRFEPDDKLDASTLKNMRNEVGQKAWATFKAAGDLPTATKAKREVYHFFNTSIDQEARVAGADAARLREINYQESRLIPVKDAAESRAEVAMKAGLRSKTKEAAKEILQSAVASMAGGLLASGSHEAGVGAVAGALALPLARRAGSRLVREADYQLAKAVSDARQSGVSSAEVDLIIRRAMRGIRGKFGKRVAPFGVGASDEATGSDESGE